MRCKNIPDGKVHTGGSHKMPNGEAPILEIHTSSNKKLFHFKNQKTYKKILS